MSQDRTRKIVVTGVLGAISIFLGVTHWGFLPWFSGASITIMTVPVIIGAVLEGPWVGVGVGLIFGLFSLIQASVAPTGPVDVWFTNPLLSVLPRLFIGPVCLAGLGRAQALAGGRTDGCRGGGFAHQHRPGALHDRGAGLPALGGTAGNRRHQWAA